MSRGIACGSAAQRTVTVTFGYGARLRTLVDSSLPWALAQAERRWGSWDTVECVSTPDTILADLTGRTKARWQPGIRGEGNQTEADKLRRVLERPLRPGEVGSLRYFLGELPRTYRHVRRPTRLPLDWRAEEGSGHNLPDPADDE